MGRTLGTFVALVTLAGALAGCTEEASDSPSAPAPTSSAPSSSAPSSSGPSSSAPATTSAPAETAPRAPRRFRPVRAMRTVRHLAGEIGPRLATGPGFRRAARWVADVLRAEGYAVRTQPVPVPAGDSWGVPVRAGRSANVIATPPGFDPDRPHVLLGAHLDTVAVSPGAEDNASGVAVLLELARVLAGPTPTAPSPGGDGTRAAQVVLVAFGAEEPVGPGELHHFGSKHYVAELSRQERDSLAAMVSLDRVGVGSVVPLSSVPGTPSRLRDRLARVADRLRIDTVVEEDSASDHESFADAGLPAARIGSTPYAGYHSATDVPSGVDAAQLGRVGRLVTAWARAWLRAQPPASSSPRTE